MPALNNAEVRNMKIHRIGEVGTILECDVLAGLMSIPDGTIDAVFADPPYFLQLENELRRPDDTIVSPVDDEWDRFSSFDEYDNFTRSWLVETRRVLKDDGTLWVIGTYHNIFRVGKLLQDLGFWILNDIIWIKSNPMPNFRGSRFTNAHETLIWAKKSKHSPYTFNYWDMKSLNDDLQMRSDWLIPICSGSERIKKGGRKAHSTQKPLALLYRIIIASTAPGGTILDPFLGSGTTAAAAQLLGRRWVGIERDPDYITLAVSRVEASGAGAMSDDFMLSVAPSPTRRNEAKVSFGNILEAGMLRAGDRLYGPEGSGSARINADGSLSQGEHRGSIHQLAALALNRERANGWDYWLFNEGGRKKPIDVLRVRFRQLAEGSDAIQSKRAGQRSQRRNA